MWLDAFFDGLEKLIDKLRERRPRAMFWTVAALWTAAAAIPTTGAALTGAGWFSVLIPFAPLIVIALTYWNGVEWIPTPVWVAALAMWAVLPGGLAAAGPKSGTAKDATAVFLFCYGQLFVALLAAVCERRGFSVKTPFARLRLMRLRLVAAAFPLAYSFKAQPAGGTAGRGWDAFAWFAVTATVLTACALPGPRKALVAAVAIAVGAWAVLAHADPHERWGQVGENGWLWATGCYQWLRASRQDFWHGGHERVGWRG
jgi:hypothetical protein